MAMKIRYNKNVSIGRVVAKIAMTLISLYVGGTIVVELGKVMNGTTSPFYQGLTLIGWTVTNGQITDTTGTGILAVIGIVGIATIVLEFVNISM